MNIDNKKAVELSTKTAMGRAIKSLAQADQKEYKTILRATRKLRKAAKQYSRMIGSIPTIQIKEADSTAKIVNDLLSMEGVDYREVIRVTRHYRRAEKARVKAVRLANELDKGFGVRNSEHASAKGLSYEGI